jgi:hypothetical protein
MSHRLAALAPSGFLSRSTKCALREVAARARDRRSHGPARPRPATKNSPRGSSLPRSSGRKWAQGKQPASGPAAASIQNNSGPSPRTCHRDGGRLIMRRTDYEGGSPRVRHTTARIHLAWRQRGSGLAARGARAAAGQSPSRWHLVGRRAVSECSSDGGLPARPARTWLRRGAESCHRGKRRAALGSQPTQLCPTC